MNSLNEAIAILLGEKKSKYDKARDNQVKLTPEERKQAMDAGCKWSNGDCAIWKHKDSKGKVWYNANTHRAWNSKPTLKGIINAWDFIKSTA